MKNYSLRLGIFVWFSLIGAVCFGQENATNCIEMLTSDITKYNQEINCKNQKVPTAVNIEQSQFQKEISLESFSFTKPVLFDDCTFQENVAIDKSRFYHSFNFNSMDSLPNRLSLSKDTFDIFYFSINNIYSGYCTFNESVFTNLADFSGTEYYKSAPNFRNVTFQDSAFFLHNKFHQGADFGYSNFDYLNFEGSEFKNKDTHFNHSTFHNNLTFKDGKFQSIANFRYSVFEKGVSFYQVRFDSLTNFTYTTFGTKADFSYVSFDEVYFLNAQLPDTLIFGQIRNIKKPIDLSFCKTDSIDNKKCKIYLVGTDISKLKFSYTQFELEFLNDTTKEIKSSIYEQVLTMQKKEGFTKGYKELDKEYQNFKYKSEGKHITNWIAKNWWGYGHEKNRVFRNTFILLSIFTLLNTFILNFLWPVYKIEDLKTKLDEYKNATKNKHWSQKYIVYNLQKFVISLLYTAYIFFQVRFSIDKLKHSHMLGIFYFFLMYTVGLICLAYIANIIVVG